MSWQITPRALTQALAGSDRAAAKRAFDAMMQMTRIDNAVIEAALAHWAAPRFCEVEVGRT